MTNTLFKMTMGLMLMVWAAQGVSAAETRNCAARQIVLERLASGYGETRQSIGLGGGNAVIEVFASIKTGSWTITITTPDGMTCLVASGRSYETLGEPLAPEGSDV